MNPIKRFSYDMLPVLAGVLLALLISNYQQSRVDNQFTIRMIENIILENQNNITSISKLIEKQNKTIDTLLFYADSKKSIFECVQKVNGLSTPDVQNHAAKFILNSGQTKVEVEMILKLAQIDAEINNFKLATETIVNKLYESVYENDENKKKGIALILSDLMNYEKNIIAFSEEFNKDYADK